MSAPDQRLSRFQPFGGGLRGGVVKKPGGMGLPDCAGQGVYRGEGGGGGDGGGELVDEHVDLHAAGRGDENANRPRDSGTASVIASALSVGAET